MHLGGLAGVTAAVMARLGASAAFVGSLGEDSFGDQIIQALDQRGVETDHIRRDKHHNTSATVVLIDEAGERTFLHHMGTNATVKPEDLDQEFIHHARILHWGGPGITPGLEGDAMAGVYKAARDAGVTTSMDTCYDGKGVWNPLIAPSLPHLDIVCTSIEEATHYTGCDTPEDIGRFFLDHGARRVLVKLGPEGAYACDAEASVRLPAHQVDVVDTTGAGDAACAGFLYGHLHNWDLERSTALANAIGALTVQAMGGADGVTSLKQAQELMEEQP
jgi:sugar/nucleoside kinase (ribokinase family)